MRVIGGIAGGRKLAAPKGMRIRPTSDRVKEALFSILGSYLDTFSHCGVLDIFAGTGSLGIEALSRGAIQAVFVDSHKDSVTLILKNLQNLGFSEQGRVLAKEALPALKLLEKQGITFQLVFLDPPYRQGAAVHVLEHLATSPLIDAGSLLIAESAADEHLPPAIGPLQEFDRRVYGETAVSFYRLNG